MKKLFVGFCLVLVSFSLLGQEAPDGYLLVPLSEMRSWSDELKASEALLTAMLLDLKTLEGDTESLKQSVNAWTDEAESWKRKYNELLTDSEGWSMKSRELSRKLKELQVEFNKLMTEFHGLLDEYNNISTKLKRSRITGAVGWGGFVVVLLILIFG